MYRKYAQSLLQRDYYYRKTVIRDYFISYDFYDSSYVKTLLDETTPAFIRKLKAFFSGFFMILLPNGTIILIRKWFFLFIITLSFILKTQYSSFLSFMKQKGHFYPYKSYYEEKSLWIKQKLYRIFVSILLQNYYPGKKYAPSRNQNTT